MEIISDGIYFIADEYFEKINDLFLKSNMDILKERAILHLES